MDTYTEATERFLKVADWLEESDQPMIAGLQHLAAELDRSFQAATFAQYGVTFRYLAKRQVKIEDFEDEDDDLTEL